MKNAVISLAGALILLGGCASTSTGNETKTPIFAFHDPIAINLHHFLYWNALPHQRETGDPALLVWPETLGAEERATVELAIAYYREAFEGQSLLFGDDLYRIRQELIEHDGSDSLAGLGLDAALVAVLEPVLPIFRRHLWPAHHAVNRRWIADVEARVARLGPDLIARLTGALGDPFPRPPVRVDVIVEGHWAGAYTTIRPTQVTVASSRPRYQGWNGFEMVFHEAAHGMLGPGRGTVIEKLDAAFEARGTEAPRGMWHALLFYTVGWAAEQTLAAAGEEPYQAYADRYGIYSGSWLEALPALRGPWQDYLDGGTTMDEAVAAMVEMLVNPDG